MIHVGHDLVDKLLHIFVKAVSTSLLVVLFFVLQYIFDMKFQCSCEPGCHLNGVLYLSAPPLILTWVLVYIESRHQRRLFDCKKKCCANFLSSVLRILLKLIFVSAVWITAVLFDGDWYYCFMTNYDKNYTGLPCKDQDHLTAHENLQVNKLKIESLEYGLGLICGVFLLWTVVNVFWHVCRLKQRKIADFSQLFCPPYYKVVYENLLAEQVSHRLREELTKLAAAQAKTICQPHLHVIKHREEDVEDTWHTISASDFYLQNERPKELEDEHHGDADSVPLVSINRDRMWTLREDALRCHDFRY